MDLHEVLLASRMAGKNNGNGGNVDLSDYYTKSQTDSRISEKVDKEDGKGLSTNNFTNEYKLKIDEAAPQSTTYTKTETDQRITTKVAEIVSNAPDDFDTLKEISDWIAGHEDSAAAMNSAIADNTTAIVQKADKSTTYTKTEVNSALDNKVDKVSGKGLSTNDFTTADKNKLDGLSNYDDTEIKADTTVNKMTLGYQCKNLFFNYCTTRTRNGVTAIVNNDGVITFSGKNTGGPFAMYDNMLSTNLATSSSQNNYLPNGKYIISGFDNSAYCVFGVTTSYMSPIGVIDVLDDEEEFMVTSSDKYIRCQLMIPAGADFTQKQVSIYPMIRLAEIGNSTFEPYMPSIDERLTALENAILGGV